MRVITNYVARHFQAALYSLGQISRAPLASFMTCLIIGIALALPTALFVGLKNFKNISESLQQTIQITLYLKSSIKENQVTKLMAKLKNNPQIASIKAISPNQGLQELQEQAGFQNTLVELPNNPLPWALVILPQSASQLENLADTLQHLPSVDSVQFDKLWIKRLSSLMSLLQRGTYALAIFLGIAVFLVINNTIRSATQQNHKEISIIKLIGGTHAFIRRPFLYAGMIYGLLGGIIAWQLVDILSLLLKKPLYNLTDLYNHSYQLLGIDLYNTLILLGFSMIIGLLGSWLAVTRHLKTC
jgi:cell division transport system permease protein